MNRVKEDVLGQHFVAGFLRAWRRDRSEMRFPSGSPSRFWKPSIFGCETWPLRLRCLTIVVTENPAKTFPTLNAPLIAGPVGHFGDQPVAETLVISFQL